jgi:hypothetical protein
MLPITQTPAQVGSPVRRRKWEQDTGAWALTSLQGAAEQLQIEFKLADLKQLIAPRERFTDSPPAFCVPTMYLRCRCGTVKPFRMRARSWVCALDLLLKQQTDQRQADPGK